MNKVDQRIQRRFDELADFARQVEDSKGKTSVKRPSDIQVLGEPTTYHNVGIPTLDKKLMIQWAASSLTLLDRVFGKDSPTFEQFNQIRDARFDNLHSQFDTLHSIFLSAKSDFEGGYLFDVRMLLRAEVFASELEQSNHLLDEGYKIAAAVIAGTVLETTVRQLCESHPDIDVRSKPTMNRMNDDLKREGVYNQIVHRQVQGWADIRNAAAHGRKQDFDEKEVKRMIEGISDFVVRQMV